MPPTSNPEATTAAVASSHQARRRARGESRDASHAREPAAAPTVVAAPIMHCAHIVVIVTDAAPLRAHLEASYDILS